MQGQTEAGAGRAGLERDSSDGLVQLDRTLQVCVEEDERHRCSEFTVEGLGIRTWV